MPFHTAARAAELAVVNRLSLRLRKIHFHRSFKNSPLFYLAKYEYCPVTAPEQGQQVGNL
jgi:hypothetical protein